MASGQNAKLESSTRQVTNQWVSCHLGLINYLILKFIILALDNVVIVIPSVVSVFDIFAGSDIGYCYGRAD